MDRAVVEAFLPALQEQANVDLLAAYSVPPSGDGYFLTHRFEPTLLLLLDPQTHIHGARQAIQRLRIDWNNVLEAPPLVFTPGALEKHAGLFPLFARHLVTYAERLCGDDLPLISPPTPHPIERLAFLIAEAIEVSSALVPQNSDALALPRLQRLAAVLSDEAVDQDTSTADLFARVHIHLRRIVDSLPVMSKQHTPIVKDANERNLLALYEDQQRLLVVIPPLSGNLLRRIDWSALSKPMPSHLTTLNVTTTDQLYLTVQTTRPLDFALGGYRRLWGAELLSGLSVSARAVFRQAARRPSALLADGVLGAYLLTPADEAIHRVIHDYQNRLLNLRLEHELLCRLRGVPPSEPEKPLPRRNEPLPERIDAIIDNFRWWTGHYLQQMQTHPVEAKLSPP